MSLLALMVCPVWVGADDKVMHIGTLMQISPQHPVVMQVRQAYQNLGLPMQLDTMPLERLRVEAARGELLDGNLAASATLSQVVPQLVRIPVQIYQLDLTAFVSRPELQPAQWTDLQPLRVVYMAGMLAVETRLKQHDVKLLTATLTLEQALQYVARGRADVAVLPKAEADYVLRQMAGLKVQAVQPALEQLPMYHYIHQKHQALVGPLTAQFEKIMAPVQAAGHQ
ncbi:MAG: transporter substrate-binding domain-containing protein [Rheinheimera sp.]|nr:transporter substrate-binding domain-containing protein [Rheinheimera sp.]